VGSPLPGHQRLLAGLVNRWGEEPELITSAAHAALDSVRRFAPLHDRTTFLLRASSYPLHVCLLQARNKARSPYTNPLKINKYTLARHKACAHPTPPALLNRGGKRQSWQRERGETPEHGRVSFNVHIPFCPFHDLLVLRLNRITPRQAPRCGRPTCKALARATEELIGQCRSRRRRLEPSCYWGGGNNPLPSALAEQAQLWALIRAAITLYFDLAPDWRTYDRGEPERFLSPRDEVQGLRRPGVQRNITRGSRTPRSPGAAARQLDVCAGFVGAVDQLRAGDMGLDAGGGIRRSVNVGSDSAVLPLQTSGALRHRQGSP